MTRAACLRSVPRGIPEQRFDESVEQTLLVNGWPPATAGKGKTGNITTAAFSHYGFA